MSTTLVKKYFWIALDFDGTLVGHMYPSIGKDAGAVPYLREILDKFPSVRYILYTMRSDNALCDAKQWCEEAKLPIAAYNTNPTQRHWTSSPKAYAHIYVDDAALGIPLVRDETSGRDMVDWSKAGPMLIERLNAVFFPDTTQETV